MLTSAIGNPAAQWLYASIHPDRALSVAPAASPNHHTSATKGPNTAMLNVNQMLGITIRLFIQKYVGK